MKFSYLVLAAILAAFATSSAPAQDPVKPGFRIEVRSDSSGLAMRCTHGCGWVSLTVGCESDEPCEFVLDSSGMGQ